MFTRSPLTVASLISAFALCADDRERSAARRCHGAERGLTGIANLWSGSCSVADVCIARLFVKPAFVRRL